MKRVPIRIASLIVTIFLLAACTGETADTTAPTSSTVAPTTTEAETPTTAAPDTTIPAETTSTTSSVNDEAEGSGCTPGEGDLPDGEWYGQVTSASEGEIEFDLACWFTGDAAVTAAAEDGEESPPPNDYYVRNVNPTVRTVAVGENVMVLWYPEIGDPNSETTIGYAEWKDEFNQREFTLGVWIEIEDGSISAMREQWVP